MRIPMTQKQDAQLERLWRMLRSRYGGRSLQVVDVGIRTYAKANGEVGHTNNLLLGGLDEDFADTCHITEAFVDLPAGGVVLDLFIYCGTVDDYDLEGNVSAFILDGEVLGIADPFAAADEKAHKALLAKVKGKEVRP